MRLIVFCLLFSAVLRGQAAQHFTDLLNLSTQLQAAIEEGNWKRATELSAQLKTSVRESRDRQLVENTDSGIDEILTWLPEDTETIVAAQQPFELTEPDKNAMPDVLTVVRGYILGLLDAPESGKLVEGDLKGRTVRFGLIAARKFSSHPPDGAEAAPLGMIAYQGCAVYVFATSLPESVFSDLQMTNVQGQSAWTAEGKQFTQARDAQPLHDTYLIALPKPDTMLICNDQSFFSTVSFRLRTHQKGQAFPQSLPEWKYIDRSAPVWGMRRFIPDLTNTDPTHPHAGNFVGIEDTEAIGIVVQAGLPKGTVQARWLSPTTKNPWVSLAAAPDFHNGAQTRKLSEGVWEFSTDSTQGGSLAVFALMAFLGFAVLV